MNHHRLNRRTRLRQSRNRGGQDGFIGAAGSDNPNPQATSSSSVWTDGEDPVSRTRRIVTLLRPRDADAVVVSDYDKGVLTPRVLQTVLAAAADKTVCLDPKIKNFSSYRPVTVITPNQLEAERATGIEITDESSLLAAAHKIRAMLHCPHVLITRGEHGMTLVSGESVTHIPTMARDVYDVTGAGDTVIATLALALAAGAEIAEAALIANQAAGIVVGKVGTATVSQSDLHKAMLVEP